MMLFPAVVILGQGMEFEAKRVVVVDPILENTILWKNVLTLMGNGHRSGGLDPLGNTLMVSSGGNGAQICRHGIADCKVAQ